MKDTQQYRPDPSAGNGSPMTFEVAESRRVSLAFNAERENGSAASSFADAYDCIMVRVFGPTEYKVVARLIRARKRAPLGSSSRSHLVVSLEAVKVWPGNGGACRKIGVAANLDRFLRATVQAKCGSGRRNGL